MHVLFDNCLVMSSIYHHRVYTIIKNFAFGMYWDVVIFEDERSNLITFEEQIFFV